MIKIIGIVLVAFATTLLGFSRSNEYIRRIRYLKSIENCIIRIENEIRYIQLPLTDIFYNCSKCENEIVSAIFKDAHNLLKTHSGETIENLWKLSVIKNEKRIHTDDISLFISLGEQLSYTDVDGQLKALKLFEHNLAETISNVETLYNNNKKLYRWLGFYSGATIILIFI